ncbi:hypothetical protein RRG08_033045 [Elysia crispata]|uniref:Uncharacterized protein n=1 Tax=Elysia crispata TaxID=231223 RepID=A0AAE1A6W6_9GAST|nr:hypothetical protein RRG08_033045 [Elysia crispata]
MVRETVFGQWEGRGVLEGGPVSPPERRCLDSGRGRGVLEGGPVSPPGQRDGVWTVGGTRSTRGRPCVTTWSERRCLDSGRGRGVLEGGPVSPPGQRDGVWTVGGDEEY